MLSEKLRIIVPLKDARVKEQEEVTFHCEVNTEGAKAKWFRNEEAIFDSSKYIILQKDLVYTLRIRNARLDDQANYNVSLTNHRGENVKSEANLIVEGKSHGIRDIFSQFVLWTQLKSTFFFSFTTEEELRIIEPLQDIETMEKKSVTFWCKVNRLNVTLKWTKNGEEVAFDNRVLYRIDKYKHSLIIKDCSFPDEGEYIVTAGKDKSVAELLIIEAPTEFVEHLEDQTVTEFDDAVFSCQLSREKANVKWYRNGREIKEGDK